MKACYRYEIKSGSITNYVELEYSKLASVGPDARAVRVLIVSPEGKILVTAYQMMTTSSKHIRVIGSSIKARSGINLQLINDFGIVIDEKDTVLDVTIYHGDHSVEVVADADPESKIPLYVPNTPTKELDPFGIYHRRFILVAASGQQLDNDRLTVDFQRKNDIDETVVANAVLYQIDANGDTTCIRSMHADKYQSIDFQFDYVPFIDTTKDYMLRWNTVRSPYPILQIGSATKAATLVEYQLIYSSAINFRLELGTSKPVGSDKKTSTTDKVEPTPESKPETVVASVERKDEQIPNKPAGCVASAQYRVISGDLDFIQHLVLTVVVNKINAIPTSTDRGDQYHIEAQLGSPSKPNSLVTNSAVVYDDEVERITIMGDPMYKTETAYGIGRTPKSYNIEIRKTPNKGVQILVWHKINGVEVIPMLAVPDLHTPFDKLQDGVNIFKTYRLCLKRPANNSGLPAETSLVLKTAVTRQRNLGRFYFGLYDQDTSSWVLPYSYGCESNYVSIKNPTNLNFGLDVLSPSSTVNVLERISDSLSSWEQSGWFFKPTATSGVDNSKTTPVKFSIGHNQLHFDIIEEHVLCFKGGNLDKLPDNNAQLMQPVMTKLKKDTFSGMLELIIKLLAKSITEDSIDSEIQECLHDAIVQLRVASRLTQDNPERLL